MGGGIFKTHTLVSTCGNRGQCCPRPPPNHPLRTPTSCLPPFQQTVESEMFKRKKSENLFSGHLVVVLLDRLVRCLRARAGGAELAPAEEEEEGGQQHQDDCQEHAHHHNLVGRNHANE